MALQVWLPLNGNLNNQGIDNTTVTNNGADVDNNGKIGKCYSFSASSAKITNTLSSSVTSAVGTMSCWVKFNSFPASGAWYCLMQLGTAGGFANCRLGLYMQYQTDIVVCINGSSDSNLYKHSLTTNQWYHLCTTFDGTTVRLYIDGVKVWNKTAVVGSYTTAASTLFVGGTNNYYFKGYMNDVRYYSTALSPKQIEILSRGLVCHYPLNGGGRTNNNMISGTHRSDFSTTSTSVSDGKLCVGSGGNGTFSITTDTTCPVGKYSYNVLNNTAGNRDFQQANVPYVTGKKYTGSWWAKGSGACLYRVWNGTKGTQEMGVTFTLTSEWKHYSHTFTANENMGTDNCTFHLGVTGASSINICGMKLEEGEQATPWIPNPIDDVYSAMGYDSTTEYDVSGYGYNLDSHGSIAYSSDTPRYSVCPYYQNTNMYLSATSPTSTIRTISFWVKYTSAISDYRVAFGDYKSHLAFGMINSTSACVTCGGQSKDTFTITAPTANKWYHIVVKRASDSDSADVELYINGIKQTTRGTADNWNHNSDTLMIGRRVTGSSVVGYMSDFRAYVTPLTEAQIAELYNTAVSVANNGTLMGYELVEG